jgi:uncharacterized repeat protein (TIGR03847 family)
VAPVTQWRFDPAESVTVGTVGRPGQRVFLLQARSEGQLLTVKVEKAQVAALTRAIAQALEDLRRPYELPAAPELVAPLDPAFVVEELQLLVDVEDAELAIVARGMDETELEHEATIVMSVEQAARLAIHAAEVIEQGRPRCPLCGYPIEPEGHACPRTNGHTAPSL